MPPAAALGLQLESHPARFWWETEVGKARPLEAPPRLDLHLLTHTLPDLRELGQSTSQARPVLPLPPHILLKDI